MSPEEEERAAKYPPKTRHEVFRATDRKSFLSPLCSIKRLGQKRGGRDDRKICQRQDFKEEKNRPCFDHRKRGVASEQRKKENVQEEEEEEGVIVDSLRTPSKSKLVVEPMD